MPPGGRVELTGGVVEERVVTDARVVPAADVAIERMITVGRVGVAVVVVQRFKTIGRVEAAGGIEIERSPTVGRVVAAGGVVIER